jgi:hypothetical protein
VVAPPGREGIDVQRIAVGKVLLVAALCYLVGLAVNVGASFLTRWTGEASWLAAPIVGLVGAMLTALIDAYSSSDRETRRQPVPVGIDQPRLPERGGTPLPVVILVAMIVIGAGGLGLTLGVRYAVGYITGNESGVERLRRPASASVSGLSLTVQNVIYTDHFTTVGLQADNATGDTVVLPLFMNCLFRGADGTTLEADAFRSRWSEQVVPGSVQRGTITFSGHLPNSVLRASLSFATIYGSVILGGGPTLITVEDIRLTRE